MGSSPMTRMTLDEFRSSPKLLFLIGDAIIDGSGMLDHHPGGNQCLLRKNKTDITKDYWFHSWNTRKWMKDRQIARLYIPN